MPRGLDAGCVTQDPDGRRGHYRTNLLPCASYHLPDNADQVLQVDGMRRLHPDPENHSSRVHGLSRSCP